MSHSDIQPCNVRLKFLLANKSIMQPLDCKTTIHGDTNRMKNIAPRGPNSGQQLAKTSSSYHLACSVDVKVYEKNQLKIGFFCKVIVLFIILK